MWGAIKNDLIDFISTIQVDTTKTIAAVLGDQDDEVYDFEISPLILNLRNFSQM